MKESGVIGRVGLGIVLLLATAAPAVALDSNARLYALSSAPYWEVGNRDKELSRLCGLGLFNQRDIDRMYIQFTGKIGGGMVGIALKGWNLFDPQGKAVEGKTYHFYRDGTTQCEVLVAP